VHHLEAQVNILANDDYLVNDGNSITQTGGKQVQ
jgi:hypothetical protein